MKEGFYYCHCCYFRVRGGEKALGELRKGGRGLVVPERCPQALPAPRPACGDCQARGPGRCRQSSAGAPGDGPRKARAGPFENRPPPRPRLFQNLAPPPSTPPYTLAPLLQG